ncbi:cytochrome P450 [Armillaria fumosa]|nr:cytochrome P450 [Armillaria fumosa]
MTSDPKAIQHILRTSGYQYPKMKDVVHLWDMVVGRGLVAATGSVHQCQRKILSPAFSASQLKEYMGMFWATGTKICEKLHELILEDPQEINMLIWTSHAALDSIGLTSFRYCFGALDSDSSAMADISKLTYTALVNIAPTPLIILAPALWRFLPNWILSILDKVPTKEGKIIEKYKSVLKETAEQSVKNVSGSGSKDIASLLAHTSEKNLLDEDEVLSQTFTLGGEDTTAAIMAWTLYELSQRPNYQARLREELGKGPADFESTPLLNATINESLCLHPIVYTFSQYAAEDDTIPPSEPIQTRTKETWNSIPVEKGQMIMISVLPSLWGDNPDDWIPERFLASEAKDRMSVGLHANLLNFSNGVHGCIGWKFGLLEVHTILAEMLKSFEFLDSGAEVFNGMALISLIPLLKGRKEDGAQVPMIVKALSSN